MYPHVPLYPIELQPSRERCGVDRCPRAWPLRSIRPLRFGKTLESTVCQRLFHKQSCHRPHTTCFLIERGVRPEKIGFGKCGQDCACVNTSWSDGAREDKDMTFARFSAFCRRSADCLSVHKRTGERSCSQLFSFTLPCISHASLRLLCILRRVLSRLRLESGKVDRYTR